MCTSQDLKGRKHFPFAPSLNLQESRPPPKAKPFCSAFKSNQVSLLFKAQKHTRHTVASTQLDLLGALHNNSACGRQISEIAPARPKTIQQQNLSAAETRRAKKAERAHFKSCWRGEEEEPAVTSRLKNCAHLEESVQSERVPHKRPVLVQSLESTDAMTHKPSSWKEVELFSPKLTAKKSAPQPPPPSKPNKKPEAPPTQKTPLLPRKAGQSNSSTPILPESVAAALSRIKPVL